MPRQVPMSFRLDPALKDALARAAADDDRSVTKLVDRILRAWLTERGWIGEREGPAREK